MDMNEIMVQLSVFNFLLANNLYLKIKDYLNLKKCITRRVYHAYVQYVWI